MAHRFFHSSDVVGERVYQRSEALQVSWSQLKQDFSRSVLLSLQYGTSEKQALKQKILDKLMSGPLPSNLPHWANKKADVVEAKTQQSVVANRAVIR